MSDVMIVFLKLATLGIAVLGGLLLGPTPLRRRDWDSEAVVHFSCAVVVICFAMYANVVMIR